MSAPERDDSLRAMEEIVDLVITHNRVGRVDLDMVAEAVGMILNGEAPADPREREAYLFEIGQYMGVALANFYGEWVAPDGSPE